MRCRMGPLNERWAKWALALTDATRKDHIAHSRARSTAGPSAFPGERGQSFEKGEPAGDRALVVQPGVVGDPFDLFVS